jgi:hypothetical protein
MANCIVKKDLKIVFKDIISVSNDSMQKKNLPPATLIVLTLCAVL